MFVATGVFCLTVVGVISSILFGWNIKIAKRPISTYWLIALMGAVLCLVLGVLPLQQWLGEFISDSAVNPLKILILFLSMTLISVFLDETGFYSYVAAKAVSFAGNSQKKLFVVLYLLTSVLTVFTSNDVIILTFTPFILYFSKRSQIDPIPFLFAEFTAANTWSMFFIFGNPTNVYVATACGLGFGEYFLGMWLPTVLAGVTSFAILYLLFNKKLSVEPKAGEYLPPHVDKPLSMIGLSLLATCVVLMAISSYIQMEMWLICFACALLCMALAALCLILQKRPFYCLFQTLKKLPWQLVPFLISMFTLILTLQHTGAVQALAAYLPKDSEFLYGALSYLSCNVMNNIPMSVLFYAFLTETGAGLSAVFATVVGSNLGAILTPVGALAGIMWMNIVKGHEIEFSFLKFVKYGAVISIPTLLASLLGIWILQAI